MIMIHNERNHFLLQSSRIDVSFGNNIHSDTKALICNLTNDIDNRKVMQQFPSFGKVLSTPTIFPGNDYAVKTTIGEATIINTNADKSTMNQNHSQTIPHSCPNSKIFEFSSTTSLLNVSNNIEFEHNHGQNRNFHSESNSNEIKLKGL